jgi:hypothetical protein
VRDSHACQYSEHTPTKARHMVICRIASHYTAKLYFSKPFNCFRTPELLFDRRDLHVLPSNRFLLQAASARCPKSTTTQLGRRKLINMGIKRANDSSSQGKPKASRKGTLVNQKRVRSLNNKDIGDGPVVYW